MIEEADSGVTKKDDQRTGYQRVGQFFVEFSALDHRLGELVKTIFKLRHAAGDAIVLLADISKKIGWVRAAIDYATRPDDKALPDQWKISAKKTLDKIWAVNNNRVQ